MGLTFKLATKPKYSDSERYEQAIHQSGHCVAAYDLGVGMRQKGILLHENAYDASVSGVAYTRKVGLRCKNPLKRAFFLKLWVVICFAGPIAEAPSSDDLKNIGWAVGELVPSYKMAAEVDGCSPFWHGLYAIISAQVSSTTRADALAMLGNYYRSEIALGQQKPVIDAAVFDLLWPLAKRAHEIINLHWCSVEKLAADLYKTWGLNRNEIEVRLPWAGCLTIS